MNEDIRVAVSFRDHRKRKKLQRLLGPEAVLALVDLWLFAGEGRPDGKLVGMTVEEIAEEARWKGDPQQFVAALVECGWLDKMRPHRKSSAPQSAPYALHDWHDHNQYALHAAHRKLIAQRAAHARWIKKSGTPCPKRNCPLCSEHSPEHSSEHKRSKARAMLRAKQEQCSADAPSPSPSPSHTQRAREAADAWNARAPDLGRPAVGDSAVEALADVAGQVTAEILALRPEFTWAGCIGRIDSGSWLVRESQAFGFEWLFKRDQHRVELNAVKVWDGRLGATEAAGLRGTFHREGPEPVFDPKGFPVRPVE